MPLEAAAALEPEGLARGGRRRPAPSFPHLPRSKTSPSASVRRSEMEAHQVRCPLWFCPAWQLLGSCGILSGAVTGWRDQLDAVSSREEENWTCSSGTLGLTCFCFLHLPSLLRIFYRTISAPRCPAFLERLSSSRARRVAPVQRLFNF